MAELQARSIPELVGIVGWTAVLATASARATIVYVHHGRTFDWMFASVLILDLVILICLPGLTIAGVRADMGRRLDSLNTLVAFSLLVTPVLAAAVTVVAWHSAREGWTADSLIVCAVGLLALGTLPISVPAALGSLARRFRRELSP